MAVSTIASYSHDHFHRLPMLQDARDTYLQAGGDDLIDRVFKDFFVEAGMDTTFGLSMLHRHFDIATNQKVVDYNGTSSPWSNIPGMEEPKPHLWAFDQDGLLKPTEFRYTKQKDDITFGQKELEFVTQLKEKLEQFGLTKLFGLARYPGDDFPGSCEITQGMSSVNLRPQDVSDETSPAHTLVT